MHQHVECLYTLFKYRFYDKIAVKSGQEFDIVQISVQFSQRNKGVDSKPSIAKKETHKVKAPKAFTELSPGNKTNAN